MWFSTPYEDVAVLLNGFSRQDVNGFVHNILKTATHCYASSFIILVCSGLFFFGISCCFRNIRLKLRLFEILTRQAADRPSDSS